MWTNEFSLSPLVLLKLDQWDAHSCEPIGRSSAGARLAVRRLSAQGPFPSSAALRRRERLSVSAVLCTSGDWRRLHTACGCWGMGGDRAIRRRAWQGPFLLVLCAVVRRKVLMLPACGQGCCGGRVELRSKILMAIWLGMDTDLDFIAA